MKIVFMGTPDFAAASLEALIQAGHEVTAVVTQADKPKGRSGEPVPPPVKVTALKYNIPVMQPARIRNPESIEELKQYPADIYVVAAFGQILPQEVLDIPPYGCLNIHASLLPKYRGASPIQHVIICGEETTGITIMQMDAGLDTGDMLYKKEIPIAADDNYETLHDKLMLLGGEAIVEVLPLLVEGKLSPEKQIDEDSCYASIIKKSMGEIDFTQTCVEIERQVRGMTPWPSAYTFYKGKQLKVWSVECVEDLACGDDENAVTTAECPQAVPGMVVKVEKDAVLVMTREGLLKIKELQLEGKKRMSTRDFLLGVKMLPGEKLGR
ncbi:MAG: methionyl-tRNA formyltransferase [Lachnospiraceae bacterium]|nr:methionyl-tRNA formyltransferase [Lachnospiraceae bacterium]